MSRCLLPGGITPPGPPRQVGLSSDEAERRVAIFGANALTPPARENHFIMLLRQARAFCP